MEEERQLLELLIAIYQYAFCLLKLVQKGLFENYLSVL